MPLGDRSELRTIEALAGRRSELERLEAFALGVEPLVMHVQGIPGIGKTHLMNVLAATVDGEGVAVVRIDARWCEPLCIGIGVVIEQRASRLEAL